MTGFQDTYARLNTAQRQAVDAIDGPLLVLAGPGTGKTQLLAARVANILDKTDTLPSNILCLTFTESGAQAMRQRLGSFIGIASYDVRISTYHGFGSEIIREFPEFFVTTSLTSDQDSRLERPIDDLTKLQIVSEIIEGLAYDDALKSAKYYVKSVVDTLGECKKSLLTPDKLRAIAETNLEQIEAITPVIQAAFPAQARMQKIADALRIFQTFLPALSGYAKTSLAGLAGTQLAEALTTAQATNKTTALTAWKNAWLTKNEAGDWVFVGKDSSHKIRSLARIYQLYEAALRKQSLYDFDDMILRTLEAFEQHPDLRYNLQERYQYILLDEFQDTNAAQFALVQQLANHPVHEGRPNVMAVGDDDQAIYAFQGAEVSNMLHFTKSFRDVLVINLTQNYRSHHDILHTAHNIAAQIESRLHVQLNNISKTLEAASTTLPPEATIERHVFNGQADEYAWVAERVQTLMSQGVQPDEIAVLSPKHARLAALVPFLNHLSIPVSYEKRENILDTPIIRSLTMLAEAIAAASQGQNPKLDELLPRVLSLDFWAIPTEAIWRVNWQRVAPGEQRSWSELALDQPSLRLPVLMLLHLGSISAVTPLEYMLDYMIGTLPVVLDSHTSYNSPFREYHFGPAAQAEQRQTYIESLAHLSVIRTKLRDYQLGAETMLTLHDYLRYVAMYTLAEQPLINSHPIAQAEQAVQLMTAYKAKGLEFAHVFLLSVHEDIWGKKARGNTNKVGLPANLQYIRYAGSSEDELRRLLFVAVTRAKYGLYLTSHSLTDSGKTTEPVKYLQEFDQGEGSVVGVLPKAHQKVHHNTQNSLQQATAIQLLWEQRHISLDPSLRDLLQDRLQTYKLSPTDLNTFIDLEYGGPATLLLRSLLRFPQAPLADGEFGSAMHATLDWLQKQVLRNNQPTLEQSIAEFERQLKRRYISALEFDTYLTRGRRALIAYLGARHDMLYEPSYSVKSEADVASSGIMLDGAVPLTGKIDRLEIDEANKTIAIVDFKTGAANLDTRSVKFLRYTQQLYMYKLLVEHAKPYAGYTVTSGRLEFVEPTREGSIAPPHRINYETAETEALCVLIKAVWHHINQLDFPPTAQYSQDLKGVQQFIADLTAHHTQ